jgi:acetoin utilization deacetylase AcuC-like enzyme
MNLPVEYGMPRAEYCKLFADRLEQFAAKIQPQLILVSAGFDSHRADPVGSLGLETEDFESITCTILEAASAHAEGKVLTALEGGYDPEVMAECTALYVEQMLK